MNKLQADIKHGIVENKMLESMLLGFDSCVVFNVPCQDINIQDIQSIIVELKILYPDFEFKPLQYKNNYIIMALWQPSCCHLF
jgi:hypothetical protein